LRFLLLFSFVFASSHFYFASSHFYFASDAKTNNKYCFHFTLISLKSKKDGSVCFFFVLFLLHFIFVSLLPPRLYPFSNPCLKFLFRFRILRFASMQKKQKSPFFRIEAKQILLPFRFILIRSKNYGAP
jgi:hypothetical protein